MKPMVQSAVRGATPINPDVARLMLATLRAAAEITEAGRVQIAADLAANHRKAEKFHQANDRRAFLLQQQHQSQDFS